MPISIRKIQHRKTPHPFRVSDFLLSSKSWQRRPFTTFVEQIFGVSCRSTLFSNIIVIFNYKQTRIIIACPCNQIPITIIINNHLLLDQYRSLINDRNAEDSPPSQSKHPTTLIAIGNATT
ncbi:hypothetical protein E4T43_04763 [Aureobasidium subglaciale]|nr:hypothetical protein E4T43_04763 [Aureobasidium subglaciale]